MYPFIDVLFYRKKSKYACNHADYIIAASEQTKRDIIDFYGIPGEKISVLYPCTHPSFYSKTVADHEEFFKPERKYLLSIGAITPRKNLFHTVKAFKHIYQKHDLDLVVIGTAVGLGRKYLETIKTYIIKHGMDKRVHFLGNVPYKYVPGICRNAAALIYPSQFEGFGMPIVEGLFSKIPVITSLGGCFPEAGGEGAIYVNPDNIEEIADWIDKIIQSEELRNKLIDKGLQHAERFRQSRIEADILNFHNNLVANKTS
jgi:glycosyltransferase involved in cell wall biosynthesis